MEDKNNKYAAIVLAAGYSSRMGDFKPLLNIGDKPALRHLLDSIIASGITDVIVVTGHNHATVEALVRKANTENDFSETRVRDVFNAEFDVGMFSSVRAGLSAFSGSAINGVFIFPADAPLVSSKTIDTMIATHKNNQSDNSHTCYAPGYMGKKGHPLLIPGVLIPAMLNYSGEGGLKGALISGKVENHVIDTDDEGVVLDMNIPDDYNDMLMLADGVELSSKVFDGYDRVFLVRHGEIAQHSGKILLGQTDVPLSETGRAEVAKAADKLSSVNIDRACRVVASDLLRAAQTADIICEKLELSSFEIYSGLREIDLGNWDGRFKDEIEAEFPEEYARRGANILTWKASGGENYYDMRYRVLRTLRRLLTNSEGDDLLIVTHAGPIIGIISAYTGKSIGEVMKFRIPRCTPLHLDGSTW
jgi:broad specificity phosphatase PhoE/CTP:molybdopterin cytidylyltransferase MocA